MRLKLGVQGHNFLLAGQIDGISFQMQDKIGFCGEEFVGLFGR